MNLSPRTKKTLLKIAKGTAISMGAAGTTYLMASLNMFDVDVASPMIVAIAGAVLNSLLQIFKHQKELLEAEE
jgi:hypothetical protein